MMTVVKSLQLVARGVFVTLQPLRVLNYQASTVPVMMSAIFVCLRIYCHIAKKSSWERHVIDNYLQKREPKHINIRISIQPFPKTWYLWPLNNFVGKKERLLFIDASRSSAVYISEVAENRLGSQRYDWPLESRQNRFELFLVTVKLFCEDRAVPACKFESPTHATSAFDQVVFSGFTTASCDPTLTACPFLGKVWC